MGIKLKWNWAGFNEIRKSPGVTNLCKDVASQAYNRVANIEGYELEERNYSTRNGVVIVAKKYPAISDNLKNNTLAKLVTK